MLNCEIIARPIAVPDCRHGAEHPAPRHAHLPVPDVIPDDDDDEDDPRRPGSGGGNIDPDDDDGGYEDDEEDDEDEAAARTRFGDVRPHR